MQEKLKKSILISIVIFSILCFSFLHAQSEQVSLAVQNGLALEYDQILPDVKILKAIVSKVIDIITLNNL